MHFTFYGGVGNVTGSKHLLETENGTRILLDCGTFQGLPDVRDRNRSLPFPPESIHSVILSHGHLDHCGMLALLCKRGFTGKIYATPGTRDVAAHIMEDSAAIEAQDTEYRKKHHIGSPDDRDPLFTQEDVKQTVKQFGLVPYARERDEWHSIADDVRLKFYDAGHILGSAISVIEIDTSRGPYRIAYTGDLGPQNVILLHTPRVPEEEIGTLLLESTYGDRVHNNSEESIQRLTNAINRVYERKGKIIIPAFSLGRTQSIVYLLHKLTDEKKIPRFPIFVDSPLAVNLTSVYKTHQNYYDPKSEEDFPGEDHSPLSFENLTYIRSVAESKELNQKEGPYAVVSASGMMTAGRVVHHLRHSISNPKNAIFITGFQAAGTTGRRILEGASRVELYGDWFNVRAEVLVFNEFSAHADQKELQHFAERIRGLKEVILVHGEQRHALPLQTQLLTSHPQWQVFIPNEGDSILIGQ